MVPMFLTGYGISLKNWIVLQYEYVIHIGAIDY